MEFIIYLTLKESPVGAIDDHTGKKVVQLVTNLCKGGCVGYKYLDFGDNGNPQSNCTIKMQNPENGHVEIWLDDPWKGQCIGKVELEQAEGIKSFSASVSGVHGTHGVYFKFFGEKKYAGDFVSFHFLT